MGLDRTVVHIGEQRRHSLSGVGLIGADHASRSPLDPSGHVLVRRESTVTDHSAFGVWHPPGPFVEGNTGQRQAAIADRTHHKISGQSWPAANTHHEALGIDHGPLHVDSSHSITSDDLYGSAPEVKADTPGGATQGACRPLL